MAEILELRDRDPGHELCPPAKLPARMISADSHLIEPPSIWKEWLPRRFLSHAPVIAYDTLGNRQWQFGSGYGPLEIDRVLCVERVKDDLQARNIELEPVITGLHQSSSRYVAQALDGLSGEVIFPNGATMGHFLDHPDEDVVAAGVHGYNQFIRQEYCPPDTGHLFPIAQLPSTGVEPSLAELQYAIDQKFHGVVLPGWPTGGEHLSDGDLKFFKMAEEAAMPVCLHVRFRSRQERLLLRELNLMAGPPQHDANAESSSASLVGRRGRPNPGEALGQAASVLCELLTSRLFEMCPKLRFGLIETWAGWIPRVLDALDDSAARASSDWRSPELPSAYWQRNMAAAFLVDKPAMLLRNRIGVGNLLWSTDFPHSCSYWPNSREVASRSMSGIPAPELEMIVAGNAIRFFGLGTF